MVANPDTTDRSGKVEHKWYVVRTYSGFEARVEAALRERIKQFNAEASFSEILVPRENVTEVVAGQTLAQSLAAYPRDFPQTFRSVIAAGEQSGDLAPVLLRLAADLERS